MAIKRLHHVCPPFAIPNNVTRDLFEMCVVVRCIISTQYKRIYHAKSDHRSPLSNAKIPSSSFLLFIPSPLLTIPPHNPLLDPLLPLLTQPTIKLINRRRALQFTNTNRDPPPA